ncbi:MAG: hypothetical protein GTO14_03510 [Anaerolineales bacterium]|nr:hypothetical protein [Anaerolineales bacterium]
MFDVGAATTALANPTDQPLVVEILIEKDWNYAGSQPPDRPFNVGGQPDLGIHVEGDSLKEWRLSYGLGDAPQSWIDIPVPDSVRFQQQPEPVFSYDSVYQNWDIETGHNYLDTDPLTNKEIYTLRLEAENLAGTTFTAYDWFVPARASIVFPMVNWTLVPDWGWIPITGYIDTRSAASAIVSVYSASNQLLWEGGPLPQSPSNHYNEYRPPPSPLPAVAGFNLVHNYGYWGGIPQFDPVSDVLSSEGWIEYRLTVQSGARVDEDSVAVYVDNTHFNADYWPLFHEAIEYEGGYGTENLADYPLFAWRRYDDILKVSENGGGTEPRLFLHTDKSVMALDGMGSLVWERRPSGALRYPYSFDISHDMVIEDVDGDGNQEVLFSVTELQDGWKTRVLLLNAEDGTPYNGNWPVEYDKPRDLSAGYVALGDVMGNSNPEILFLEPRNFYYGIPEEDLAPAKLHVLDLNGNGLWVHEFAIEDNWIGPLELVDLDGNGKDEIFLLGLGMVLQGNDTIFTGWESLGAGLQSVMLLQKGDSSKDVVVVGYGEMYLKSPSGVDRPGWPIEGYNAMVGQIVSGGDEEIVLCGETLNVFETSGNQVASFPEVNLDGTCDGLEILDVDQDGVDEIVVLVHRYKDDPAANERIGSFLEAFELNGTRLADGDDRWPIVLALQSFFDYPRTPKLNRQVAFGDVDGDGHVEVVQHLHIGPYGLELVDQAFAVPSAQIEILHLE